MTRSGRLMQTTGVGVGPGHDAWPMVEQAVQDKAALMGGEVTGYEGSYEETLPVPGGAGRVQVRRHTWSMVEVGP